MKAHRTDLVSFAFGLTFLALALWWLLARILGLTLPPVGWFLTGALILIGLLGLVGALRSGRHAHREPTDQRPETTVAAPYVDGTPTTAVPSGPETDEWATDAVTDDRVEAREDVPFTGEPRWSPSAPPSVADVTGPATGEPAGQVGATRNRPATEADPAADAEPATRELPAADAEPATRKLPAADAPEWPAGGRRPDGDGPGRPERPAG